MTYRYCPTGDKWLETSEYTVDETGETVCPDHKTALHGSIQGFGGGYPITENEYYNQNKHLRNAHEELEAAKRQGLVA